MSCLLVGLGCGGGDEHPWVPNFSATAPVVPSDAPARPREIPAEEREADAEGAEFLRAHWATPEGKLDSIEAPPLTKKALLDTALLEARSLEPVGKIHAAQLIEGERVKVTVPAGPDLCLTVVAHGGLGVMEADAFVVASGSSPPKILAQDTGHGPKSVVGGIVGCYVADPEAGRSVDVIIQARRGSGPIVFAVYEGKNAAKH